jgi:hypothetical protein
VAALNANVPGVGTALPLIVIVALAGEPSAAPLALESVTVKVLEPVKAVVLIGTEIVFGALSPSAHVNVPDLVV